MIDWRDMPPVADTFAKSLEDHFTIRALTEYACSTANFALYDYGGARDRCADGDALADAARELREMRTEWRRLDQWADDGGRA